MKKIYVARAMRGVALLLASVWAGALGAEPELRLASPFTDHMVLQRDLPVPVWGTAPTGESVTVEFAGQKKSSVTDADGHWRVELEPLSASSEARALSVHGTNPKQALRLEDVLVGEVWLASGQSNMDFTVAKTEKYYFAGVNDEAAEVAAADYPRIRMFTGMWARSYEPQARVEGAWKVCTPENVREFSAIGYFFARDLQKALDVPVGIVTLTYGASTAQAWIRREAIATHPFLASAIAEFDKQVQAYVPPTAEELATWQQAADKAKAEGKRPPRRPKPEPAQDQHNPTVMWNGMVAPAVPYAVRGVLWYQGESITGSRELFAFWNELLVSDWRNAWGRELPFYFCQLAAHQANSNAPEVRELQTELLDLPATGMAVTIDVGDPKDVHPHNKQDVGARLARIALARTYGRDLEYSGPQLEDVRVEGRALRIKFSHLGGGLVARNGPLKTLEIAAADKVFVAAEGKIEGDSVVVTSKTVDAPVAARYAWSSYPEGCNLFNAAGLPAAPFRTDRPIAVYLIGGQSNATGQGYVKNLPPEFVPNPSVLLYHSGAPHLHGTGPAETWQPLQPASESPDRFGPELTFGNRLREIRGRSFAGDGHRIALIKHAHSGTNLYAQWAPGADAPDRKHWGEQFATFVATVDAGLAALRTRGDAATVAGMIWLQGEGDADKGGAEAEAYAANLTRFIARVREQFHAPDMPFLYAEIARLPERGRGWAVVRRAQHDLSDSIRMDRPDSEADIRVKRARLVPTDDLSRRADDPDTAYPDDRQHFGSRGMFELGARMAEELHVVSVTRRSSE